MLFNRFERFRLTLVKNHARMGSKITLTLVKNHARMGSKITLDETTKYVVVFCSLQNSHQLTFIQHELFSISAILCFHSCLSTNQRPHTWTNQLRLVSTSPLSINKTTFVVSSRSSAVLVEC